MAQADAASENSDPFPGAAGDVDSDLEAEGAEIWGKIGSEMNKTEATIQWQEITQKQCHADGDQGCGKE